MSNYVLLYNGGGTAPNETERKKRWDEWNSWYKKLDRAVVDQGYPFASESKSIWSDGKIHDSTDCPSVTGYTIIQAMSLDAAIQLAKNCPALKYGAKVSVYETMNSM